MSLGESLREADGAEGDNSQERRTEAEEGGERAAKRPGDDERKYGFHNHLPDPTPEQMRAGQLKLPGPVSLPHKDWRDPPSASLSANESQSGDTPSGAVRDLTQS